MALIKTFADQGSVVGVDIDFGYRIWNSRRTIVRDCDQLRIPFVDIFLIDNESDQHKYITEEAKRLFPGQPLPFGCFERLIDVPFGHLTLRSLNLIDAQEHFNENFDTDWNEVACRNFDHVTGDSMPLIRVALDLRRPALHSQHSELKR